MRCNHDIVLIKTMPDHFSDAEIRPARTSCIPVGIPVQPIPQVDTMIYLTPEGGLCNRLRSMASVWRLAQMSGQDMAVNWWRTDDMNCSFDQLFLTAHLPFSIEERNLVGWRGPWMKIGQRLGERLRSVAGQAVLDTAGSARLIGQDAVLQQWARGGNPRIRTNSKMLDGPGLYALFQPVPALQQAIDSYLPKLGGAIGVHVRRTDNLKSARFSPITGFIELLQDAVDSNPTVKIFVATDAPAVFAELKAEFGERVFEHPKTALRRDDPRAIRDAVVDLYCLANCQRLLGSYWSSFSDVAWEINGIEHVIVHAEATQAVLL